ncbi:MAG: hypothetical protein ABIQ39_08700 [Ilumatobacteraceae bacterium]
MADIEPSQDPGGRATPTTETVVTRFTQFLQVTLRRLTSLAFGVATAAATISVATFLTGLWAISDSRLTTWTILGGALCAIPLIAGIGAWLIVRRTAKRAPRLIDDVRSLIGNSRSNMSLLIDHDTGQPLATTARSLSKLNDAVNGSRSTYPSLAAAVWAATRVPGLVAITVLGTMVVGLTGTILLIGKLLS